MGFIEVHHVVFYMVTLRVNFGGGPISGDWFFWSFFVCKQCQAPLQSSSPLLAEFAGVRRRTPFGRFLPSHSGLKLRPQDFYIRSQREWRIFNGGLALSQWGDEVRVTMWACLQPIRVF